MTARLHALSCALCLAIAVPSFAQEPPPTPSFMSAVTKAQQAIEGGDHVSVRGHLRAALLRAPEHPYVLLHLARVEATLRNADGALEALERLGLQGVSVPVTEDTIFAELGGNPRFDAVLESMRRATEVLAVSDSAWTLPDVDFIPEGIAYDAVDDVFYISSLHRHSIVRVTRAGDVTPFASVSGPGWMVGLRLDGPRRLLWAAELSIDTAAPAFARGIGGWGSLRSYDLSTGALVRSYAAPFPHRPQLINDVAVLPNGDVYVTDSEGGAVYRLRSGADALEQVYGDTVDLTYPNGIAASANGDRVYVAHVEGLSVLDLNNPTPVVQRVDAARGIALSGIDGLYLCGTSLLAVQSLPGFQQVVLITLDSDGTTAIAATPLERRHPAHRGATTGAIAGDSFYYIANAQLDRLGNDAAVTSDGGVPSVVLRLPIGDRCPMGVN